MILCSAQRLVAGGLLRLVAGAVFRRFVDDHLVGEVNLNNVQRGAMQSGTLGYWIDQAQAGHAYVAEAVVVLNPEIGQGMRFLRKMNLQLSSKMRFLSAQLDAYLTDDLWLGNARAANAAAHRLADGLTRLGIELAVPAQANLVFPKFAPTLTAALRRDGYEFLDWPWLGDSVVRLVCGFSTPTSAVDQLLDKIKSY